MHAAKGEPEQARERLEAALAIVHQLGARNDAAWVVLRRLAVGHHTGAVHRAGPAAGMP